MILETLLVAGLLSAPDPDPPRDRFFGEDKVKHFVTSFVVTSLGASGARVAGLGRRDSIIAASSFSIALGVGKEIHDARRGDFFSVRDLLWDIAGTGAGVLLLDNAQ